MRARLGAVLEFAQFERFRQRVWADKIFLPALFRLGQDRICEGAYGFHRVLLADAVDDHHGLRMAFS
jgi:hypothetical protein